MKISIRLMSQMKQYFSELLFSNEPNKKCLREIHLKGTLMEIWKPVDIFLFTWKNIRKIWHDNTFCFLRYVHVRYVKWSFTNIQKQHSMLKISLLFKKFTNFTRKTTQEFLGLRILRGLLLYEHKHMERFSNLH